MSISILITRHEWKMNIVFHVAYSAVEEYKKIIKYFYVEKVLSKNCSFYCLVNSGRLALCIIWSRSALRDIKEEYLNYIAREKKGKWC